MKYKCTYTTGSGTEHNDGIWIKKVTPKTLTLEKIEDYMTGVYRMHDVGYKTVLRVGSPAKHKFIDNEDGTFTLYFNRAGTPYYFEPIC